MRIRVIALDSPCSLNSRVILDGIVLYLRIGVTIAEDTGSVISSIAYDAVTHNIWGRLKAVDTSAFLGGCIVFNGISTYEW